MLGLIFALTLGAPVAVRVDTTRLIQTIRPIRTLGTSVDSDPKGKISLLYSPSRTQLMLSTGLGMLTYRLYTELSIQDWHWNPSGSYSDAQNHQGYWTSSAAPGAPIGDSFGYRLPHRGDSRDQGDDDGYSRIDDGDPATYWKSNPYLTHVFTGEPDSANPQWAVVQFLSPQGVDAIRIAWTNPFATHYAVQYWVGKADAIVQQGSGVWRTFPNGEVSVGKGSTALVRLGTAPIATTAVRIWMTASSNTCDTHGSVDIRNCLGYAIQDVGVGTIGGSGKFRDLVVRTKKGSCGGALFCTPDPHRQTLMWTSSDDPWHAQGDKVTGDQEQTGLDRIARNPITRGLPAIYPVPVFYSTPQNAANEVRYLERRGYPISYIEMGEEVDGQYALPEDYAALYVQFARAIHAVDPRVKLGGPVFEGVSKDVPAWRNTAGDASWLHRFLGYLRSRGRLNDLSFMSWEHYPYHNCDSGAKRQADLLDEPSFVRRIVDQWHADGLPKDLPLLETEDNFSPDGTGAPQRVYGALWYGDFIGASLASGVSYMTYYQGEPEPLGSNDRCKTWGAYNPYIVDQAFNVRAKGAAYYAIRLIAQQWLQPGDSPHGVFAAATSLGNHDAVVTAYSVRRPDGNWSVLIDNKDSVAHPVTIVFAKAGGAARFAGKVRIITFGSAQYAWSGKGPADRPNPDKGLAFSSKAGGGTSYLVPARSLTVIRGAIGR